MAASLMTVTDTPEFIVVKDHFADIVDLLAGNAPVITQFSNHLFSSSLIPKEVHLNPKSSPYDRASQLINSVLSTIETHSNPSTVFYGLVTSLQKVGLTDMARKLQQSLRGRSYSQVIVPAAIDQPAVIQLSSKDEVARNIDNLYDQFSDLVTDLRTRFEQLISEGKIKLIQVTRLAADYLREKVRNLQADSIDELFDSLRPHYDFLNCSLLRKLTNKFLAHDELQLSLSRYIDDMDKLFESSQLKHIRSIIKEKLPFLSSPTTSEHTVLVVFELHSRWEEMTLKNFKRVLSYYFGSIADLFSHIHFDYGSLIVKMLIPTSILQLVTNILYSKRVSMNRIGIFQVAVNGKTVLSIDNTDINFEKSLMDSEDGFETAMLLKLGGIKDAIDLLVSLYPLPRRRWHDRIIGLAHELCRGLVFTLVRLYIFVKLGQLATSLRRFTVYILFTTIIAVLLEEYILAASFIVGSNGGLAGLILFEMYIRFTRMSYVYLDNVCVSVGITGVFILFVYSFYFTQFIPIFLGATIGAAGTVLLLQGVDDVDLSRTCYAFVIGLMIGAVTGAILFESIRNTMFSFVIICLSTVTMIFGLLVYLRSYHRSKKQQLLNFELPAQAVPVPVVPAEVKLSSKKVELSIFNPSSSRTSDDENKTFMY